MKTAPIVGSLVRLTGRFLRSTGQSAGDDGRKVWTVQACPCALCRSGRFVATNEPAAFPEPGEPTARHVAVFNLERAGYSVPSSMPTRV